MQNAKEFGEGFHTFNHTYGSLNNSPDRFNIVLFSHDQGAIRTEPDEASVRARWKTKFAASLRLEGNWQVRLRRLFCRNLQSHQFTIELHREFNLNNLPSLVTSFKMERQYFHTVVDVIEEVLKTLEGRRLSYPVQTIPFTKETLMNEKIFISMHFTNYWEDHSKYFFSPRYFGITRQDCLDNYLSPVTFTKASELFVEEEFTVQHEVSPRNIFQKIIETFESFNWFCFRHLLTASRDVYNDIFDTDNTTVPSYLFNELTGEIDTNNLPNDWLSGRDSLAVREYSNFFQNQFHYSESSGTLGYNQNRHTIFMFISSKLSDLLGFTTQQQLVALGGSSNITVKDCDSGDYKCVYLHTHGQDFDLANDTIFIEGKNVVTGASDVTADIITVSREQEHDVKMDVLPLHRLEVKSETGETVIKGEDFYIREEDMNIWLNSEHSLNRTTKMDEIDVYISELKLLQKDLAIDPSLRHVGQAMVDKKDGRIVNCVSLNRDEEMIVYEGNRRSFKWLESIGGLSEMTVELRSTHDESRSPWFHVGYTMAEFQFQRNFADLLEERL